MSHICCKLRVKPKWNWPQPCSGVDYQYLVLHCRNKHWVFDSDVSVLHEYETLLTLYMWGDRDIELNGQYEAVNWLNIIHLYDKQAPPQKLLKTSDDYSLVCWSAVFKHVCAPTVSDEGPAREHLAEHKLDHSQDDAHQAADDGHTEQESILRETGRSTERDIFTTWVWTTSWKHVGWCKHTTQQKLEQRSLYLAEILHIISCQVSIMETKHYFK